MTKPLFLDNDALWPTLKRLHRKTKRRSVVAVPYVGEGAAGQLRLRRDDVLICALTLANARAGSICPAELRLLQKKGVRIYVRPQLHAKVYLFGESAVVPSANLSTGSESRLDECGMLIRDRRTVRDIKEWLQQRMIDPLRKHWLDRCEKAYRRPHPRVGDGPADARRLWLIATQPAEYPEKEMAAWKTGMREAEKSIGRTEKSYVDSIRWSGGGRFAQDVATEDRVVQVYDDDDGPTVYPHGRVLNVRRLRVSRVTYVYVELPERHQTIRWTDFRASTKTEGLQLPKAVLSRLIPRGFTDLILRWTNLGR